MELFVHGTRATYKTPKLAHFKTGVKGSGYYGIGVPDPRGGFVFEPEGHGWGADAMASFSTRAKADAFARKQENLGGMTSIRHAPQSSPDRPHQVWYSKAAAEQARPFRVKEGTRLFAEDKPLDPGEASRVADIAEKNVNYWQKKLDLPERVSGVPGHPEAGIARMRELIDKIRTATEMEAHGDAGGGMLLRSLNNLHSAMFYAVSNSGVANWGDRFGGGAAIKSLDPGKLMRALGYHGSYTQRFYGAGDKPTHEVVLWDPSKAEPAHARFSPAGVRQARAIEAGGKTIGFTTPSGERIVPAAHKFAREHPEHPVLLDQLPGSDEVAPVVMYTGKGNVVKYQYGLHYRGGDPDQIYPLTRKQFLDYIHKAVGSRNPIGAKAAKMQYADPKALDMAPTTETPRQGDFFTRATGLNYMTVHGDPTLLGAFDPKEFEGLSWPVQQSEMSNLRGLATPGNQAKIISRGRTTGESGGTFTSSRNGLHIATFPTPPKIEDYFDPGQLVTWVKNATRIHPYPNEQEALAQLQDTLNYHWNLERRKAFPEPGSPEALAQRFRWSPYFAPRWKGNPQGPLNLPLGLRLLLEKMFGKGSQG